jgi:putative transposase
LSYHTSKLYNIANYDIRTNGYKSYYDTETLYKDNWHSEYMHSHTYQQCLRLLEQDWKSYYAAIKDYKKHKEKYLGAPRIPGFKNDKTKAQVIFTNYAIRLKDHQLLLSLSKKMQKKFSVKSLNLSLPKQVIERIDFKNIQQIRIRWNQSHRQWEFLMIYKQEEETLPEDYTNLMSIDLGLDNLCAITFMNSTEQYLINGKSLKSKNAYFNKAMGRLTGIRMKETGSTKFARTKAMVRVQQKRNRVMLDTIHKVSRKVIDLAVEQKCRTILIGDLKGIKQQSNIKSFVQIPIQMLMKQIKYKAKLKGIEVILVNESYTSGVSAPDMEPVTKESYDKSRRIKRGLFVTNTGKYINSDINGSLNIMRKYLSKTERKNVVPMPLTRLRNNGCLDHPVRLLVA